jgi:uncharacterized protein (TIGR03000 family)
MLRASRTTQLLLAALVVAGTAAPVSAWQKIMPYHFGRYDAMPSVYGYPLDDYTAGYYGGARYKEYYAFGRGYALADFPGPVPDYAHGTWFRYKYWPYGSSKLPSVWTPAETGCASITVQVPADAQVWLEGHLTQQSGTTRTFVSPALPPKQNFVYQVRVRWTGPKGVVEQKQKVEVQAGAQVHLQFPLPAATQSVAFTPPLAPVPEKAP